MTAEARALTTTEHPPAVHHEVGISNPILGMLLFLTS